MTWRTSGQWKTCAQLQTFSSRTIWNKDKRFTWKTTSVSKNSRRRSSMRGWIIVIFTLYSYIQISIEFAEYFLTPTCPKLTRSGCDKLPGCRLAALSSTLSTRHAVTDENSWTSPPRPHVTFITTRTRRLKHRNTTACTVVHVVVKASSQSDWNDQILTPSDTKTPERISMLL